MGSITHGCELCQNETSPLTTRVNVCDFALARANHYPDQVQNHPHLHLLFMQKSFIFVHPTITNLPGQPSFKRTSSVIFILNRTTILVYPLYANIALLIERMLLKYTRTLGHSLVANKILCYSKTEWTH